MLKPLLLFLLVIWANWSVAQLRQIPGFITCNDERQSGVAIKNLGAHTQTVSDDRGEFTIKAKTGDTLITMKPDYVNDTLMVADQPYFIVKLHRLPQMLKEVTINGLPISPESVYAENKKEYKDIYWKGDKSHIIVPGSMLMGLGIGFSINIDKLYSALSKQGKDARRLQHTLTRDYKNSVVDKRFNPLAARITGYTSKRLTDFIQDNRPSYEMTVKASDYDIIQYIRKKLSGNKS